MKTKMLALGVGVMGIFLVYLLALPAAADPIRTMSLSGIGTFTISDVLTEPFDELNAWESYSSPSGAALGIQNGVYRAYTPNAGYLWGLNSKEQSDSVVEVEVTPLTIYTDTGAGIMCRADVTNNGDGYYFMINANGYYSIRVGRQDDVAALVDWQRSSAVHTGIDRNNIRAVCVGNQLAMYVNNQLVDKVVDDTYGRGFTGLTVAAGADSADMAFDNLTLYSIQPPR